MTAVSENGSRNTCRGPLGNRFVQFALIAFLAWVAWQPAVRVGAEDLAAFNPSLSPGTHCLVEIDKVHPTQCAVGYLEVDQRGEKSREDGP